LTNDYLIYNVVHKTFIGKIKFEFGNKFEKMCVSNRVWYYKHFLDHTPQC